MRGRVAMLRDDSKEEVDAEVLVFQVDGIVEKDLNVGMLRGVG